jgi:succinoglycan biosynthesis transport protein ExoP
LSTHLPPGLPPPDVEYPSQPPDAARRETVADLAGREEWSGIECFRILRRRRTTLAWITSFGVLAGGLVSLFQPRAYQSEASLEIQGFNENFLNLKDIYPTAASTADSTGAYVQTQAEMLQQDSLIEQVARKLHLDTLPEYQGSPSFSDKLRRITGMDPSPATPLSNAVEAVKKDFTIMPSRGSRIIRIVCEAREPQLAADLVNTLAETFIEESIEARQRAARQTYESLSEQLEELRSKLLKSEAEFRVYGRAAEAPVATPLRRSAMLKRELDATRQFYEAMAQRVSDASVASAVRQSNIRLVGPAQPPAHPYKPNLPLNLAIGTFGGLALAIGYVLLREQTNSILRAPGEAGAYLNIPELGAIPKATRRNQSARSDEEPHFSGLSEAFRATSTSILSAGRNGDHPRVLVVTSSQPMEGKTTVVSSLGVALAEIGGRVLLIDGDMRRPRLHKVFNQANSWGLSEVLSEKNAIEELPLDALVKKTTIPNLYLLPSGAGAENIFSLLCSGRMARLLPRFRQEFDYVLVDAPPCLEFADARIMARYAEKLLLVVRADYTDRKTAQAAVQRLLLDGIPVMGVILNCWDPTRSDAYGYAPYYSLNRQDLA